MTDCFYLAHISASVFALSCRRLKLLGSRVEHLTKMLAKSRISLGIPGSSFCVFKDREKSIGVGRTVVP